MLCVSKQIALVTGATGFVGSHLTRRLVEAGWDVHLIMRPASNLGLLQAIENDVKVHLYNGETETMHAILKDAAPTVVFHFASLFLAQHEPKDVEPLIRSNVLFGTQLLDAMAANGVCHLINTGTSWQHYENQHYNPVCLYAATKQAFESILTFYTEMTHLKAVTLKLFDTYGPNDPRKKLFFLLRKAASEDERVAMSPGEQYVDMVYIDDVVDAFILAAERIRTDCSAKSEAFIVSSGRPVKLRDLADVYSRVTGVCLPIDWGGRPYRLREVMNPWSGGIRLPGWEPKIGLEEGIRRMERIHAV